MGRVTKHRSSILVMGALLVVVALVVFSRGSDDEPLDDAGVPIGLAIIHAAQSGCGGEPTVEWTGGTWRCTFSDDFEGRGVDLTKWTVLTSGKYGFRSGVACFVNDRSNVSVASGRLHLTVRPVARTFRCPYRRGFVTRYTGGMVTTLEHFDQTYGRFEIRARFPAAKVAGLKSGIWLWPSAQNYGRWPRSGEIDVAEYYSRRFDRVIPFVHYASAGRDPTVTNNSCLVQHPDRFHTYVLEWTPDAITIAFDGQVCVRTGWDRAAPLVNPAPFDRPFYLNMTQTLGTSGNAFNPAATPLPATMEIDYVHIWG